MAPLRRSRTADRPRRLGNDGEVRLAAAGDSVAERLVELLLIMRDAQRDGSWARLKACANDECQWAFYDRSRNHGGTWCDMSACGNKLKNREFRARRRGENVSARRRKAALRDAGGQVDRCHTSAAASAPNPFSDQCSAIGAIRLPLRRRSQVNTKPANRGRGHRQHHAGHGAEQSAAE